MDEDAIAAVVKEIEEEKALGRVSAVQVFQSILNQPALLSISSASATEGESGDGYTAFTVNMPRPILQVKELELLTANIPLCTQNIPDTACAFWYYRLSLYSGKYPNPNNLFFVRLLPSYYKPEFVRNFEFYGYNQTFNGYPDIARQLALATTLDLAQVNLTETTAGAPFYRIQYLNNNEVKLTFDSAINKFKFAGNFGLPTDESTYDLIEDKYNAATTYGVGDLVKDTVYVQGWGSLVYESQVAGNTGNPLPVYPANSTAFWARNYNFEGVAPYSATTAYKTGQFVERLNLLYRAVQNTFNNQPPNATYWEANPIVSGDLYRYMATGPLDPDVAFMQGTSQRTWSRYALYEADDNVLYKGITYKASKQNLGVEPFPVPNQTDNDYSPTRQYQVGDYVYFGTLYYINVLASKGVAPTGSATNNANWNFIVYDTQRPLITIPAQVPPKNQFYQVGDIVTYATGYADIPFFRCKKAFPPANSLTGDSVRYGENEFWEATYWTTGTSPTLVPYVGLAKISAALDMLDVADGGTLYPFPEGIPPQPFSLNPKRLLNSILGFTWNGKFLPSQFDQLYTGLVAVTGSTTTTELYNRLRPLPDYITYAGALLSSAGSVSLDPTFTANGYAKLVYTSVINIYASIAGGSTIDTIRNTNLIGTMAMNAGNLGIGFSAAYLNATLQTQDSDIYSISFSFTDEYGDPYPLTNNAVVTLTFRMGYKN